MNHEVCQIEKTRMMKFKLAIIVTIKVSHEWISCNFVTGRDVNFSLTHIRGPSLEEGERGDVSD